MKRVFEYVKGIQFHNLDEVVYTLKDAGYEVEDVTTQYATVWEDGELVTLMFGGSTERFHVCYMY